MAEKKEIKTIARLGSVKSDNTNVSRDSAMIHYGKFLNDIGVEYDPTKPKTIPFSVDMFQRLGTYLSTSQYAKKDRTITYYAYHTVMQTLSAIFCYIKSIGNNSATNVFTSTAWYEELRNNLGKVVSSRIIASGEKIIDKSPALSMTMLDGIIMSFMKANNARGVEMAYVTLFDYLCCGR